MKKFFVIETEEIRCGRKVKETREISLLESQLIGRTESIENISYSFIAAFHYVSRVNQIPGRNFFAYHLKPPSYIACD